VAIAVGVATKTSRGDAGKSSFTGSASGRATAGTVTVGGGGGGASGFDEENSGNATQVIAGRLTPRLSGGGVPPHASSTLTAPRHNTRRATATCAATATAVADGARCRARGIL